MPKTRAATWLLVSMVSLWGGRGVAEPPELKETPVAEAKQRLADEPTSEEEKEEVLVGHGVVVESVGKGSALEKAGLQPGDVLYRWLRLPNPSANPDEVSGELESPFDWWDVEGEHMPRSAVDLIGRHAGEPRKWSIPFGESRVEVRPNWPEEITTLYLRGLQQIKNGEVEAGVVVWQELAKRQVDSVSDPSRLWLQLRIAEILGQAKQWDKIELFLKELESTPGMDRVKAHTFHRLGIVALRGGDLIRAMEHLRRAAKIRSAQATDSLTLAATLNNLGIAALGTGDLAQAAAVLEQAVQIEEKHAPGSLKLSASLSNLAVVERQRGDLPRAERYLQRTLKIEELQAPESRSIAATLNNLGAEELIRGDLFSAAEYLTRALAIQEKNDRNGLDVAAILGNLGAVMAYRGELQLASEYFSRSLKIREAVAPNSLDLAHALHNFGAIARDLGDLSLANSYYEKALAIKNRQVPESLDLSITLGSLGVIELDRGNLSSAAELSRKAMEIQEAKAPNGLDMRYNLSTLGNVARRRGNLGLATAYYSRALEISERIAPDTSSDELLELGRLARLMGKLDKAETFFERSLKVIESQVAHLGSSHESEARFLSRQQYPVYREALSLQVEINRPEVAFHLLERSRAQSFLAMLAERELVFSDLPSELDSERRRLAVQYDRTLQSLQDLSSAKDEEKIKRIQGDLLMLRQRQQEIQRDIRERFPKLAAIQYPQPLDVAAVRKALDPGTVLLAYSVGEKETFLFSISSESGLSVKRLSVGEAELRRRVIELRHLLDSAAALSSLGALRAPRLRELAKELYALLVQPAEKSLGAGQRLLVLTDGPLHLLPFAALERPDGQYLGTWRPLHTALSATVWAELKASRRPAGAPSASPVLTLAAFGDPHYPGFQRAESQVAAADTETKQPVPGDFRVRAAVETGLFDWNPLPGTRREVQEIARLFPEGSVRTFLGQDATEETAKALGCEPRIIHFALHGHLDDRFPWNSALALTIPESPPEGHDNGLLQVWEILESVRVDADLVVLSACETGLGDEQGGEGLIGLTRAFQYAGARSVLASLWNVNDQATSELMIRFYKHLRAGLPKDRALQAAQQELIRGPIEVVNDKGEREIRDFSAPYYWAGFQLYGDWQ